MKFLKSGILILAAALVCGRAALAADEIKSTEAGYLALRAYTDDAGDHEPGYQRVRQFLRNFNDTCNLADSHIMGWIDMATLKSNRALLSLIAVITDETPDMVRIKIPLANATRIELADTEAIYSANVSASGGRMKLALHIPQEGTADIKLELELDSAVFTKCFNEFAYFTTEDLLEPGTKKNVARRVEIRGVSAIYFEPFGKPMWNKKTGRIFPESMRYDPFDGSELVPLELPVETGE